MYIFTYTVFALLFLITVSAIIRCPETNIEDGGFLLPVTDSEIVLEEVATV